MFWPQLVVRFLLFLQLRWHQLSRVNAERGALRAQLGAYDVAVGAVGSEVVADGAPEFFSAAAFPLTASK